MKRLAASATLTAIVAVAIAVPAGPGGAASAAGKKYVGSACGVGAPIPNGDGKWIHLSPITRRKGIDCAHAKRVAKDASNEVDGLLCDDASTYKKWSIRHVGNENAMAARFTRGKVQFDLAEQGGC